MSGWLFYNGIIEFSPRARERVMKAVQEFPVREIFCDCTTFLLIDSLSPDVTLELKEFREKLRRAKVKAKGKVDPLIVQRVALFTYRRF